MATTPEMQKGRDSGKSATLTTRANDIGSAPLVAYSAQLLATQQRRIGA
ncbi:hypothetical protein [Burkholderia stagnalis]|nr:hypothetical protein [Burkholderia stagnalis]